MNEKASTDVSNKAYSKTNIKIQKSTSLAVLNATNNKDLQKTTQSIIQLTNKVSFNLKKLANIEKKNEKHAKGWVYSTLKGQRLSSTPLETKTMQKMYFTTPFDFLKKSTLSIMKQTNKHAWKNDANINSSKSIVSNPRTISDGPISVSSNDIVLTTPMSVPRTSVPSKNKFIEPLSTSGSTKPQNTSTMQYNTNLSTTQRLPPEFTTSILYQETFSILNKQMNEERPEDEMLGANNEGLSSQTVNNVSTSNYRVTSQLPAFHFENVSNTLLGKSLSPNTTTTNINDSLTNPQKPWNQTSVMLSTQVFQSFSTESTRLLSLNTKTMESITTTSTYLSPNTSTTSQISSKISLDPTTFLDTKKSTFVFKSSYKHVASTNDLSLPVGSLSYVSEPYKVTESLSTNKNPSRYDIKFESYTTSIPNTETFLYTTTLASIIANNNKALSVTSHFSVTPASKTTSKPLEQMKPVRAIIPTSWLTMKTSTTTRVTTSMHEDTKGSRSIMTISPPGQTIDSTAVFVSLSASSTSITLSTTELSTILEPLDGTNILSTFEAPITSTKNRNLPCCHELVFKANGSATKYQHLSLGIYQYYDNLNER